MLAALMNLYVSVANANLDKTLGKRLEEAVEERKRWTAEAESAPPGSSGGGGGGGGGGPPAGGG
eukprot:SAG22_NODE_224_length_14744_cov_7.467668_1_plen_63_part_10